MESCTTKHSVSRHIGPASRRRRVREVWSGERISVAAAVQCSAVRCGRTTYVGYKCHARGLLSVLVIRPATRSQKMPHRHHQMQHLINAARPTMSSRAAKSYEGRSNLVHTKHEEARCGAGAWELQAAHRESVRVALIRQRPTWAPVEQVPFISMLVSGQLLVDAIRCLFDIFTQRLPFGRRQCARAWATGGSTNVPPKAAERRGQHRTHVQSSVGR